MNCKRLHPRTLRRSVLASAIACCFVPGLAAANPVGPTVTHGQANFNTQGKLLTVTNTPGAIINWQSFSIAAGETTRFVQQSAASAVLNRVVGKDVSAIFGALQSNGRVFLINPNGILFGAGAQIDTAGLVASTLNMLDADFLKGRLRFGDTPGAGPVRNAGEIRTPLGGRVLLIAPESVENAGIIHAPNGEVILAAGKSVELSDSINPEVRVEVSAPESRAINLGKIVAESGRVGIYGSIVANHGVVSADSAVVGENGKIVFKATRAANLEAGSVTSASGKSGGEVAVSAEGGTTLVAGEVKATASEGTGGEVRLLGERVGLAATASVDVSGERGGGAALVGGDVQGANPEVRNAQMTYVADGARIHADARSAGDGGKVVVWANDTTRSYGHISARGGETAGNGGFVETSGKLGLDVGRGPDLRAPAGKPGTWLLDPIDLDVIPGSGIDPTANTGAPFFAPLTEGSTIGVDLINAQLDFGSNVVLTTTSQGPTSGSQPGNITIRAPIVKSASSTDEVFIGTTSLTLQAHNEIVIAPGGSITSTGDPLNVSLQANLGGMGGAITIGDSVVTRGGFFQAFGRGAIAVNAAINTTNAAGTSAGSVSLSSSNSGVSVAAPVTGGFFSASAQGGSLNVAAPIASRSSVSLSARDGVTVAPGTAITARQFSSFSATATGAGGFVTIGAGASVSANSATLVADNMDIQGTVNAGSGSVSVRQGTSGRAISVGTESGSALSLTQLELDNLLTTGTFSLGDTATGPITVSSPIDGDMASSVNVVSGASYTQNASMTLASRLSINAPIITIAAPLTGTHASGISLTADTLNVSSAVNAAAGELAVNTRSFGQPIHLGVSSLTGSALELTDAQQANLTSATQVRFSTGGPIHIAGPVTRASGTLVLESFNSSVTQAPGASISVPSLGVSARNGIDLTQANDVTNFAADLCCTAADINFFAAAGKTVNITAVDGISGVSVSNFTGTSNINLRADDLNILQPVSVNSGAVSIAPTTVGRTVTLGADAAGTLGLTGSELNRVSAANVSITGDRMNIAGPVSFFAATTTLGPATADLPVRIVGTKTDTALEFVPGELSNLTGSTIVLGGANAGAVSVDTVATVPNTVSKLVLHSGGLNGSLTIASGATLSATNSLGLVADTMDLQAQVESTSGSIEVAPHTTARAVDLGAEPAGSLGLNLTELANLKASAGTLKFGHSASPVNVTGAVTFAAGSAANVMLEGMTVSVNLSSSLNVPGALSVNAQNLNLLGPVNAAAGNVDLVANTMTINSAVTAAAGDINVRPRDFRDIDLAGPDSASVLDLSNAELNNLMPSGILRIGSLDGMTGNITVRAPVSLPTGRTLSLKTAAGGISQDPGAPITILGGTLVADALDFIALEEANQLAIVALRTTSGSGFDSISFARAPGGVLDLGNSDGVAGVSAGFGFSPVTLTADQINVNQDVRGSTVDLLPATAGTDINIGTKNAFSFTQAELNRIFADAVTIGNATAGNITVSQPITVSTFADLELITGAGRGASVGTGAEMSVPGKLSITAGTLSTAASLTSTGDSVSLVSDALTLGGTVNAFDSIEVRPLSPTVNMDLGGADTAGVLGITAAEVSNLFAPALIFGDAPRIDVTAPIATQPTVQRVELRTDDLVIPVSGGITTSSLWVSTMTDGRNVDLGAAGTGPALVLDAATLGRLTLTDALSVHSAGSSTLTVRASLASPGRDLSLSAGTINVNESLSAAEDISLRADSAINIAAGKTVASTGGGDIMVASRSGGMTYGPGGLIDAANLARLSTSGFVELGDSNVAVLNIAEALDARPFGGLVLAGWAIMQDPNATIAADQLRVQSGSGSVSLTENNSVDVLAGNATGAFSFTNAGALQIGTVDTVAGVAAGSSALIRADSIDIASQISASNVTLAPRLAGAAIDLGSEVGFGITQAELDRIFANTLNIGVATGTASGPITVSAPVNFANTLNLVTAPGSSIAVNAALGSTTGGALTMNAGAGGSVNIAAPVSSASNVRVTADTIVTSQPITSAFGSVFLRNVGTNGSATIGGAISARSGIDIFSRTIAVNAPLTATASFSSVDLSAPGGANGSSVAINGAVTAGSSISVATDNLAINAPLKSSFVQLMPAGADRPVSLGMESGGSFSLDSAELALIDASQLWVGSSSSGDLQVNAPIGPFTFDSLTLVAGGNVSQTPGSTITVRNVDPDDPTNVSGSLDVFAGGSINLPEANDIAVSVSGSASGPGNDFVFNNVSPLKLQNLSGVTSQQGKVRVRTAVPPPLEPEQPSGASEEVLQPDIVRELNRAQDVQQTFDKDAQARKEEAEKREREEQKKRGTQSCS